MSYLTKAFDFRDIISRKGRVIINVHTFYIVADDNCTKCATAKSLLLGGEAPVCTYHLYPGKF